MKPSEQAGGKCSPGKVVAAYQDGEDANVYWVESSHPITATEALDADGLPDSIGQCCRLQAFRMDDGRKYKIVKS